MNASIPQLGLVGLGGYAEQHLTVLTSLQEAGLCRLVAVADPFADRFPEKLNALRATGTKVHANLDTLLCDNKLDAIFLATPIQLHAPQAIAALDAGCNVYLEKPPCATLGEYAAMDRAQQAADKILAVGFQLQHAPAYRFLRRRLAEGAIGKLNGIWSSVRWSRRENYYTRAAWAGKFTVDGQPVFDGPATNALAHAVHAALSLAGATDRSMPQVERVRGCLRRARPIESYDTALLEAVTDTGVHVKLAFSHATEFQEDAMLRCQGSHGTASLDWSGNVTISPAGGEAQSFKFYQSPHTTVALDFLHAIQDPQKSRVVTLRDTLPYLQTVNGARQSSGGAHTFAADSIELVERPDKASFYRVAQLDEQMAAFRTDFDAVPPLLLPDGPWLPSSEILPSLA